MIGRLQGILLEKQPPGLLININGVAYEVSAPMTTFYRLPEIGQQVTLHTHFISREDGQWLYGFFAKDERQLFRYLIKVNGVGPKLALTILSRMEPNIFVQCVMQDDSTSLVRLPGVGKKTAERLVIEMRDKLKDWQVEQGDAMLEAVNNETSVMTVSSSQEANSALVALGFKPQQAKQAVARVAKQDLTSEELIRLALKELA